MRQALVVGGAGSLGAAVVAELLARKVAVAVAGRSPVHDAGVGWSEVADATATDWRALYERCEGATKTPVDAVVFVAGAAVYGRTPLVPDGDARRVFELNFWACAAAATAAALHWTERGRSGATFLAVLSIAGRRAVPFESHYAASKAAAARFLECLDLEYGPRRLRFLAVYPGTLRTPFRRLARWYGLTPPAADEGSDVRGTAHEVCDVLQGRRRGRVIGWRERSIDLADRLVPGLYDAAVLRRRVNRVT